MKPKLKPTRLLYATVGTVVLCCVVTVVLWKYPVMFDESFDGSCEVPVDGLSLKIDFSTRRYLPPYSFDYSSHMILSVSHDEGTTWEEIATTEYEGARSALDCSVVGHIGRTTYWIVYPVLAELWMSNDGGNTWFGAHENIEPLEREHNIRFTWIEEVTFTDTNTGTLQGRADDLSEAGQFGEEIHLRTTDGGLTWTIGGS